MPEVQIKAPAVQGELSERPLPRLLQQLYRKQFTGHFVITDETKDQSEVYVRDGSPVHICRPVDTDRLDNLLVEYGLVPAEIVAEAGAQVSEGQRLGDVLERMGALDKDKLANALKAQVTRKLTRLFFVHEGSYAVYLSTHGFGVGSDLQLMRIDPRTVIYPAIRAAYDLPRATRELARLAGQRFRLADISPAFVAALGVPPEDATIEALRGGWLTLDELDDVTSRPFEVRSVVLAMYYTDSLERENVAPSPGDAMDMRPAPSSASIGVYRAAKSASESGASFNLDAGGSTDMLRLSETPAPVPAPASAGPSAPVTSAPASATPQKLSAFAAVPAKAVPAPRQVPGAGGAAAAGSSAVVVPVSPLPPPPARPPLPGATPPAAKVGASGPSVPPPLAAPAPPPQPPPSSNVAQPASAPAAGAGPGAASARPAAPAVVGVRPSLSPPFGTRAWSPSPNALGAGVPRPSTAPAAVAPRPLSSPTSGNFAAAPGRGPAPGAASTVGGAAGKTGPQAERAPGANPGLSATRPMAGAAKPSQGPEAVRASILDMATKLDKSTHFEILGVSMGASADEVGTAFVRAARQFHPDRLAGAGLADLQPVAERILARINEAAMVLGSPPRRAEYVDSLKAGAQSAQNLPTLLEAENQFLKGEVYLKKGDYPHAIEAFTAAVKNNPEEPQYHAYQAWARFEDPRSRKEVIVRETLKIIEGVLKDRPRFGRGHYWAGQLWKFLNEAAKAEQAFREAVRVDEALIEASRELRLIEMRKSKGPQKPAAKPEPKGKFWKR